MNFKALQTKREQVRPELMARFPFPPGHEKCSETGAKIRSVWKEMTQFSSNHIDGDCRGGETGHAETAVASMFLRLADLETLVYKTTPDAADWEKRLKKQKTAG